MLGLCARASGRASPLAYRGIDLLCARHPVQGACLSDGRHGGAALYLCAAPRPEGCHGHCGNGLAAAGRCLGGSLSFLRQSGGPDFRRAIPRLCKAIGSPSARDHLTDLSPEHPQ